MESMELPQEGASGITDDGGCGTGRGGVAPVGNKPRSPSTCGHWEDGNELFQAMEERRVFPSGAAHP